MTPPNRDLAQRLGIGGGRSLYAVQNASFMLAALDAMTGAGFTEPVIVRDFYGCSRWHLFVWIVIYDYDSFGALNQTVGIASGALFEWLAGLKAEGIIRHEGPGRVTEWSDTERGRLAAYLVRATLEEHVSGPGSGA